MNQDILKDLVTTSVSNDYDYDKVLAAFPELQGYDRQVLQDYVQTAVDNDFKYHKVNKAFPEFFPEYAKTKKEKTSKGDTTTESENTVSTSDDGSSESQDQTETTEVEETETPQDPNFNEKADEYAKTKKDPNAPLTANELASMPEAKVSSYIRGLAPGATVEETGFGNQVVVKMPGKEKVFVDLSEFTGMFDETATSELQEILNLAEEQKNDTWITDFKPEQGTTDIANLAIQSKGGRYSEEQISVMNSTYSNAGYEFNMTDDGLALGFITGLGSAEVEIKKDGEVVFTGTPEEVQDFMYSDINSREDKEELLASASEVRETTVTHLRNESEANANKKIQELVGDPNEVDKRTFREKGNDILASLDNEKNERFRFANIDDSSLKRIIARVGSSRGTNEEKIKYFNEEVEGRMLKAFELSKSNKLYKENADELPAIQEKIASLQSSFANIFNTPESTFDEQGNEIPGQSIVNKARTSFVSDFSNEAKSLSYEKTLNDSGLGSIVLAQGVIDEKEAKVGLENVKKQREVLKTDVQTYQKKAKEKSDKLMANASKDGVTSVKFDEITKTYSVTANNEEVANRYEKELNSIASGLDAKFNQYTNGYNATESSYSSFAKQANDASLLQNVGSKDYNNINAIGYDVRNSFSGTWNSIGVLFGSDRAEAALDADSEQAAHYETMPEYTDVENFGGGLNFATRTLGQQSAPIALAMVTGGAGASLGLTGGVTQTIVATTFGVSSAGGKKAELNKLQYDAYDAKIALDELELAKGNLDPEQYKRARKQLESTISLGNFSNWQKQSLIYSTGIIEGVTTRFLGTIPNVNKAWKSFANPVDDLIGAANRNAWQATAHGLRKWGVAAAGEIAEEEIIHFGTAGAESVILGTEFDPSGWDDVLVTSLITAGATNGPSTMYSTVMSHQVTSDLRNRFNLANDKVSRINDRIANLDPNSAQTKILREEKAAVMNGIVQLNSEMEMTAMMMGGKDAGQIVEVGNRLNELDQQAQVDPTAPENVQREQRNNYLNSLDAEDAKAFRSEYKTLNDKKNKIQEKAIGSFDNAVNKIYGDKGQRILDKLIAKNPELKDASSREQAIAVHEKVKDDNYKSEAANGRTVADKNPDLKAQVEQMVYGDGGFEGSNRKNRKKKEEDYYYAQVGKQNKRAQASGIVVNSEDNQNVAKILGDERMKNLVIKPAKTKQDVINQVSEAYDNVYNEEESAIDNGGKSKLYIGKNGKALDYSKMKPEEKELFKERAKAKTDQDTDSMIKELVSGQTNAAIVGGNYIVQGDVNTVAQQLAEGNILAGTAMSHEINHAVDARAFTTEGLNNYSSNLMEYMDNNHQDAHMSAMMTMNSNGYYNPNVSMDNQSDTFKDEYTKSIGDYFRSPQNQKEYNKLKKNTGQSLGNFARGVVGGKYKINTPKSAATYLVDFTEAMRKGTGLGDIQKRVIDNAKLDEDVSASTKRSANSPILHSKANALGKKVNALYENKNSNPEYAFDIAKEYEGMVKKFLDRMELEGKWDLGQGETRTNNISDFIMNATLAERGVLGMVMGKGFKENEMVDVKDPKTGETVQEPNTISRYLNGTFPQRLTEFVGGTTIDPGIFKANLENMGELVSTERADKLTDEMVQEANNQFDTPLLSSLPFTQELLNDFRAEVAKTVGVKLPALDAKQGKNQSISPLIRGLKKQFGVKNGPMHNVVKEMMGKTKAEIEAFLVDPENKKAILEAMTTSWLASNLPMAVEKKVRGVTTNDGYTTDHVGRIKGTKPGDIEAWNASEDGPYKGMTDGKQKIRRNRSATTDVTSVMLLKEFANGNTITDMNRSGLTKLQLAIAQELGLETFKADLLNDGELKEVFEDRQDLFDRVLADNFVEEFVRQSERGVTKRSANINPNAQYSLGEEILDTYINNKGDRIAFEHEVLMRGIPLQMVDNFDLDAIDNLMSDGMPAGYKQPLNAFAMEKGVSLNVRGIIKEANDMGSFNQKDKKAGDKARVKTAEQVGKLVDALPLEVFASPVITPAFFGFSSSSRGFDTSKLDTKDYSPAAKKAMLDLENKINKKIQDASKLTTVSTIGFNPKDTRLFNAGVGLMGKVDNILNSNETAEQKRQAHNDQYGNEHNAANLANPLMLELINNTFLDLAKTDRDAAVGWVYWNSMNTNNTSGPRSLSTWNLTQYENGPQGLYKGVNVKTGELEFFPSKAKAASKVKSGTIVDLEVNVDHPSYKVSEVIAEERANELVNEGKLDIEDIEKEIELMLFGGEGVKNWQGGLLRAKGEHVTASATTSAEIVIAGLKSLDNKNFDAKTEIKKLTQNFDQALGAKSLSDIQDHALGTTSRLGYGRVLALKTMPFTKLDSFKTLDGTTATDLAINQFAKTDNIQVIENLKRSLNPLTAQELKDVKIMDNTVRMARTTMKSAKPRGMSTFDFDDTLAFTKSGIRLTMPNPSGKPQPKRKAILLAGNAGAGKTTIINKLGLRKQGFKYVNQDIALDWLTKNNGLPKDMNEFTREQADKWRELGGEAAVAAKNKASRLQGQGDGVVIDGTGAVGVQFQSMARDFSDAGYDVQIVFVESSLENAVARNKGRSERRLTDVTVRNSVESAKKNKKAFKEMVTFFPYSAKGFIEVNTDNFTQDGPLPADLVKKMDDFTKGYIKDRINAEDFALRGADLLAQGAEFEFSEFNKVVDGTPGPLLDKAKERAKKFGTENMFVLTARPAEAAKPIQAFLKNQGIDIPLENITGLGNSTGEAKALWMLGKFEEGYNDMYFVDDALPNVDAVKNVLDQLDIKSDVQIAKRSMNPKRELNFMLERSKGVDADETFNRVKARNKGIENRKKQIFIPPSAEDFQGLMYYNMGKGVQGEADAALFKKLFYDPFNRADRELDMYRQTLREQVTSISKKLPKVRKKLRKEFAKTGYTNEQAMRIYLYDMNGHTVPGISEAEQKKIAAAVAVDSEMVLFANAMQDAVKIDGYIAPANGWNAGSFNSDLADASKIKRTEYLQEWNDNIDAMFDADNLNKLEAVHGSAYRSALEDSIRRMKSGTNRPTIKDKKVNAFLDWTNGSVGAIMFFNARSAVLQTLSTVNFINFEDNNIFAASKAFANQKQFWTDFKMLYNSPMLRQRRGGLQTDVSAEELSRAQEQGGTKAVIAKLLQIGFTPTQIADSFAISAGGASFYRNRVNKYLNEGFTQQEADSKAFDDFQEIAEQTQQSSRPDKISQEQASVLGRLILAFQNTPMQYNRLIKKAALDLINGRGSVKANVSRILYYGAVQNLIFASLQNALFAAFGDDEEDEEFLDKKIERIANGTLDSLLRGSGIYGAIISTVKNTLLKWQEERAKGVKQDNAKILVEALNVSPPIGSKVRKLNSALNTDKWNKQVYEKIPLYNIDNPIWDAGGHTVEAVTNIPLGRIQKKISNLKAASDDSNATWQRAALVLGWDKWGLGIDRPQEVEEAKQEAKEEDREVKKQERKAREAEVKQEQEEKYLEDQKEEKKEDKKPRCAAATKNGGRCKGTPVDGTYCTIHARVEQRTDGKDVQCKKIKSDGKRCGMQTSNKSGLCYYHD